MTHTPTPWKVEEQDTFTVVVGNDGKEITSSYDRDHAIKCVNLHDELVEALIEMVNTFAGYEEKTFEEKIETALKASKVIQKAGSF